MPTQPTPELNLDSLVGIFFPLLYILHDMSGIISHLKNEGLSQYVFKNCHYRPCLRDEKMFIMISYKWSLLHTKEYSLSVRVPTYRIRVSS